MDPSFFAAQTHQTPRLLDTIKTPHMLSSQANDATTPPSREDESDVLIHPTPSRTPSRGEAAGVRLIRTSPRPFLSSPLFSHETWHTPGGRFFTEQPRLDDAETVAATLKFLGLDSVASSSAPSASPASLLFSPARRSPRQPPSPIQPPQAQYHSIDQYQAPFHEEYPAQASRMSLLHLQPLQDDLASRQHLVCFFSRLSSV